MADALVAQLSRHVNRDCAARGEQGWLFAVRPDAPPPHQNTVGHHWRPACARAGVTGVTLHDLRHFCASALNTYAHLWPSAEDRTRQAADELMLATLMTSRSAGTSVG